MRPSFLVSLIAGLLSLAAAHPALAQAPVQNLSLRLTAIPPDLLPPPENDPVAAAPPGPAPPVEDAPPGRVVRVAPVPAVPATDETETGSIAVRRPLGDPYEALGIRRGGLVLYPSVTVGVGSTSNAEGTAGGSSSAYSTLEPELLIRSDWPLHEATLAAGGSFRHFFAAGIDDQPELNARGTARLDLGYDWSVPLAASYTFRRQSFSDPDFPAGADTPPGVHELKGSLGGERTGPLRLAVAIDVDRSQHDTATSGGVPVDLGDRNNTVIGGRVRIGYATTPLIAPFIEAEVARRQFDRTVDEGGLKRSGALQYYGGGVAFDGAPVLTGEIKFGYGIATFDEPSLADIQAFTVDGRLLWSPTVLTTVTLDASTAINPSANPASSGSVVQTAEVEAAYAWRENITLNATASTRQERFQGIGQVDTGGKAGVAATWKANRVLWLSAGYEHEWLASNLAGRGFEADAVRLEIRAQR